MTTTDRRDATDAQFADELARLNRLGVADESTVERVARAMWEADAWPADQWEREGGLWDARRSEYRNLARAAIAALKPAPGTDSSGPALAEAWAALPGPVADDAAPEGTSLADRIKALGLMLDEARAGWSRCHERHMAAERADTSGQVVQRVLDLAAPGEPDARMDAYYYGFERTGVGIVDGILSAVAQAGKSYHGTDMWSETDEWTPVSHADLIQAAADLAAARIRDAVAGPQRDHDEEGCPADPHHGVDCPGDACRFAR